MQLRHKPSRPLYKLGLLFSPGECAQPRKGLADLLASKVHCTSPEGQSPGCSGSESWLSAHPALTWLQSELGWVKAGPEGHTSSPPGQFVQTDNTPNCRLATLLLPASCLPLNSGETGGRCLRLGKCVQVARRPPSRLEIGRGAELPVLTSLASSVCLFIVRGVANHPSWVRQQRRPRVI